MTSTVTSLKKLSGSGQSGKVAKIAMRMISSRGGAYDLMLISERTISGRRLQMTGQLLTAKQQRWEESEKLTPNRIRRLRIRIRLRNR